MPVKAEVDTAWRELLPSGDVDRRLAGQHAAVADRITPDVPEGAASERGVQADVCARASGET